MPVSVFDFDDYKSFVNSWVRSQPKKGRGLFRDLAGQLRSTTAFVSQVFRGDRDLSLEQALVAARFLKLRNRETDHFLLLVQYARAGTEDLRQHLNRKLAADRIEYGHVKNHISPFEQLSPEAQATFYSDWNYAAVQMACSIDGLGVPENLASRLGLEPKRVREILSFLVKYGICIEKDGAFRIGPTSVFVERESPHYVGHHRNWRLRSIEALGKAKKEDLFFTSVVSLSRKDYDKLRKRWLELIAEFTKTVVPSPEEKLACLHLDWFEV